jgi:hypothetical protein
VNPFKLSFNKALGLTLGCLCLFGPWGLLQASAAPVSGHSICAQLRSELEELKKAAKASSLKLQSEKNQKPKSLEASTKKDQKALSLFVIAAKAETDSNLVQAKESELNAKCKNGQNE